MATEHACNPCHGRANYWLQSKSYTKGEVLLHFVLLNGKKRANSLSLLKTGRDEQADVVYDYQHTPAVRMLKVVKHNRHKQIGTKEPK